MIVRQSLIRQAVRVIRVPAKSWTRSLATEVDRIEASLDNQLKETHSIEANIQSETSTIIPRIDGETHASNHFDSPTVASNHQLMRYQKVRYGRLGTEVTPSYDPTLLLSNPPSPSDITLELLLASQSHLGHNTSRWNPMNSRYIFGIRQGIHVISLEVTAAHLRRACRVVSGVAERGGLILFVGTRKGQDRCVVSAAQRAGGYHVFEKWLPGCLTNGHQLLARCKKKIVDEFDRKIEGLDKQLRNRPSLKPDLVVCLNPLENWVLLHECALTAVPTIGIIDTDANPTWVTYPIPANDDSLRCVQLIAGVLGRAAEEGQLIRKEKAHEGVITYTPVRLGGSPGDPSPDDPSPDDLSPDDPTPDDPTPDDLSPDDLSPDPNPDNLNPDAGA